MRRGQTESMGDLRLAGEQEAERLLGRQPGQPALKGVEQLDPAATAAGGVDRDPGLAERFDITQDRAFGHLECSGELSRGQAAAVLQDQQHVQQPGGPHGHRFPYLTKDVRYSAAWWRHDRR